MNLRTLFVPSLLAVAAALSSGAPARAETASYKIDPVHSEVGFSIRHIFSKVHGTFGKYDGAVQYDATNPAASRVQVDIDAASISTANTRRDTHLKSPDFFDVEKFPALKFVSTKVTPGKDGKLEVEGNLTIRDVTKPVTLHAAFLGAGPGPDGVARAGFEGTTRINRKDFGIVWNKALDQGSTLLGDDVDIDISVEAVHQSAPAGGEASPHGGS